MLEPTAVDEKRAEPHHVMVEYGFLTEVQRSALGDFTKEESASVKLVPKPFCIIASYST